jgi:transposase
LPGGCVTGETHTADLLPAGPPAAAARLRAGLDEPWQEAFRQAWEALRGGNIAVGACASTADGVIVHAARNRVNDSEGPPGEIFGSALAHAETNVLARLPFRRYRGLVLTTTLAAEPVLGADETPVNVLAPAADPQTGEPETGSPHVLVIRTPGGTLTWLRAMGSRRHEAITAILGFFTGFLICDGYEAYPRLLPQLAGLQQCAAHVIRRCRAAAKLGPGGLQSWAAGIIEILRDAHRLTGQARARDGPPAPGRLGKLRRRYDEAAASGIIHNRLRDWDGGGNHPGYALGCWLRDHADQVWLFTREPAVDWTNNVCERGAKAAKRHQAVSGYWHSQPTLARWCRIRSYMDSATAHGLTALAAITAALAGKPWLPAAPAAASITA